MAQLAISAQGLGKSYPIIRRESGARYQTLQDQFHYRTFREDLARLAARMFEGRGARRGRETKWALQNVSFSVSAAEVVGIIGRNGAGKSTLLKILARITEPTTGFVDLYGRAGSLLEVGTGFHPELTGRENIQLSGTIYGMTRRELRRKFADIVEFAEIEQYLDTPVKRYSSGMYMRLAFSVAAHLEPEILMVDEVLAVGDAGFQRKCLNKMQDVGQQGRTVLFVSHDMAAVTRLCPRAILLNEGHVQCDGAAPEVTSAYLASGAGTMAEREWRDFATAPGDEYVRLQAVRVRDENGKVVDTVDIRRPVHIEIEYHNMNNDRFPFATVKLFDEGGTCLFAAGDFTNVEWRRTPRHFDGVVRSKCTIPGNLLAEGRKRVTVELTTHNPDRLLATERDAVAFMVVDRSEGDGARGEFGGTFPGVFRPLLEWHVEVLAPAPDEERAALAVAAMS